MSNNFAFKGNQGIFFCYRANIQYISGKIVQDAALKKILQLTSTLGLIMANTLIANTTQINTFTGLTLTNLSNTGTVTPASGLTNTYIASQSLKPDAFLGFGAEYIFTQVASKPLSIALGLSGYFLGLSDITGTETPGSNLGLTAPLNYSLTASSMAVMLEPKLIYTKDAIQPYFMTGIGADWNSLRNFSESTPPGSLAAPSNPYANATNNNFAYEFAVGLQYHTQHNKKLSLRVEYRYFNLGTAELGAATGQTTNQRLSSHNMSTNILDIGLGYQL